MVYLGVSLLLILGYLGIRRLQRWISEIFGGKAEWWFDIFKFVLIPIAAGMTLYGHLQTQHARQLAEEKLEALNPYNKPIITAVCNVSVAAAFHRKNPFEHPALTTTAPSGILRFMNEDVILLELALKRIITGPYKSGLVIAQPYNDVNIFQLYFSLSVSNQTIRDLRHTQTIEINSDGIRKDAQVYEGKGRCTINSTIEFGFVILPQIVTPQGYFLVEDLSPLLDVLQERHDRTKPRG
jgi:hypothetical protein